MGCAAGWFTAVRDGALPGTTFEIDVSAALVPRAPMFSRAYVTATEVELERAPLERAARGLGEHVGEALPDGATPLALVQLTSHRGHFLGRVNSHLLVYEHGGAGFIRDVGCWDPLPARLSAAYATAGREAQQAFWGPEPEDLSMLAQLARVSSRRP
jgi:hypothetical protein